MQTVLIGNIPVGDAHPPVFIAEVGSFFNKDIELALDFLQRTSEAGAPIFKTEILHDPDTVLADVDLDCRYQYAGGEKVERYRDLIERKVLSLKDYERILTASNDLGIPLVATVFDEVGVDFLKDMGGAGIKVSRNNLNHVPLLRKAARSGLPVMLDSGEVYLSEIAAAVELVQQEGGEVMLNHHPGSNPAPASIHNMRMIDTYKKMFSIPIGLACHYRGKEMMYVAVARGANLLEKGVVDDPDRAEVDLVSAMPFTQLKEMLKNIYCCWESLGDGILKVPEDRNLSTRTGMYAKTSLKAGEALSLSKVGFAWPPVGISPQQWDNVAGWGLVCNVVAGEPIVWSMLQSKGNEREFRK